MINKRVCEQREAVFSNISKEEDRLVKSRREIRTKAIYLKALCTEMEVEP